MGSENKRRHKRFSLEKTRVELGKEVATLQDFSKRGIGIRLRNFLHIGEKVNLRIYTHKAKKPMRFKGEVRWTERTAGFGCKAGIRLLQGDSKSTEFFKKLYQRFENPVWRRVPSFLLPTIVAVLAIILVGILSAPKIGDIAHARTVSKYATEKLKCPMCVHTSYSTEYAFLDIPEEMNEERIVICPKCHKQISYYDLEVVWRKK
ncbi:PilZ domain-containing protein [bacterium]|nr:PilZ domain-containing protein [bacterium]